MDKPEQTVGEGAPAARPGETRGESDLRIRIAQNIIYGDVSMELGDDGVLLVRAPLSMSRAKVLLAVEEKRGWIRAELARRGLRVDAPIWVPMDEEQMWERFRPNHLAGGFDRIVAPMPWGEVLITAENCAEGTWTAGVVVNEDGKVVLTVPASFTTDDVADFLSAQTALVRRGLEEYWNTRLIDLPGWRPAPFMIHAGRSVLPAKRAAAPKTERRRKRTLAQTVESRRQAAIVPLDQVALPESGAVEAKVKGVKMTIFFRKESRRIFVGMRRTTDLNCLIRLPKVMTRAQLMHYIAEHQDEIVECLAGGKEK